MGPGALSAFPLVSTQLIRALYCLHSQTHRKCTLVYLGCFFHLFSLPAFDHWLVNCLGPQRSPDHQLMYLKGICLFWKCKYGLPQRLTGKKWPTELRERLLVWSLVPPSITPRSLSPEPLSPSLGIPGKGPQLNLAGSSLKNQPGGSFYPQFKAPKKPLTKGPWAFETVVPPLRAAWRRPPRWGHRLLLVAAQSSQGESPGRLIPTLISVKAYQKELIYISDEKGWQHEKAACCWYVNVQ